MTLEACQRLSRLQRMQQPLLARSRGPPRRLRCATTPSLLYCLPKNSRLCSPRLCGAARRRGGADGVRVPLRRADVAPVPHCKGKQHERERNDRPQAHGRKVERRARHSARRRDGEKLGSAMVALEASAYTTPSTAAGTESHFKLKSAVCAKLDALEVRRSSGAMP